MKYTFYILTLIIVIAVSVISFRYYNNYTKRDLNRAIAFEELGEYKQAKESYTKYLLKYHDDYHSKIKYSNLLRKMAEYENAIIVLTNLYNYVKKGEIQNSVSSDLKGNYNLLCDLYKDSSEVWLIKGNIEKSRYYSEKEFEYRYEGRFYNFTWDTSSTSKSVRDYLLFEELVALKAKIAILYRADGLNAIAEKVLDDYDGNVQSDYSKWIKRKHEHYASALFDTASIIFSAGDYKKARDVWNESIDAYKKGGSSDSSEACLNIMYNIALTYWNKEQYWSAISEFNRIINLNKNFQKNKIRNMINTAQISKKYKDATAKAENASKLFGAKTYDQARNDYRKSISLYIEAGLQRDNPELCRLRYNIAMAFINDRMYSEALKELENLQNINPRYDVELVYEKIMEVTESNKLFE